MNPACSSAARTSRPDRSVGSLDKFQPSKSASLRSLDFDKLLACFRGDRIASVAAVLDVKLNGFTDVVQRFGAGTALADAAGQCRHIGDVSSILFLLQNDRVPHCTLPSGVRFSFAVVGLFRQKYSQDQS